MKQVFKVGTEHSEAFQYLGLHLNQEHNCILLDQVKYISNVDLIEIPSFRKTQKKSDVTCEEQASLRLAIGQLNWAASQTRTDLAFETCYLGIKLNSAKVEDLVDANKALKKHKYGRLIIAFPNLGNLTDLRLVVFAGASYANLPNGASQEGFIIFLANQTQSSCPISWASRKVKHIVKSTLAAETLAMVDAADTAYFMARTVILGKGKHLQIDCYQII